MNAPETRALMEIGQGRSNVKSGICVKAHQARYLGHLPISHTGRSDQTESTVSTLVDQSTLDCSAVDQVYIDVKSAGLVLYRVDYNCKVTETIIFDLSRISYCNGNHRVDPRVFAWVYRQETSVGFQLECHVIKVASDRKAKQLAMLLQRTFETFFKEVQAALDSSRVFAEACAKMKEQAEAAQHCQDESVGTLEVTQEPPWSLRPPTARSCQGPDVVPLKTQSGAYGGRL